ncbi:MAG TPA: hypothetical protein VKY59_05245 [Spirillospora sp.]|nr:hypothetical protein [Spirillospora sp.]
MSPTRRRALFQPLLQSGLVFCLNELSRQTVDSAPLIAAQRARVYAHPAAKLRSGNLQINADKVIVQPAPAQQFEISHQTIPMDRIERLRPRFMRRWGRMIEYDPLLSERV